MVDQVKARDKACYKLAHEYLLGFEEYGVTPQLINKYLHLSENAGKKSLNDIYKRLLESAMNAGMRPGVIKGLIGELDNLNTVLFDFNPKKVEEEYHDNWGNVFNNIQRKFKPRKKLRKTTRSIWPLFCKSITSGAIFLSQFRNEKEFYDWVDFFDKDDRARAALPFLISEEVNGIGFALACDFLKELGYINFGKPDVHIKAIFKGLGLCEPKDNDYKVFKAIVRVAKSVGISTYNVDKLFWLIGSGSFYDDMDENGKILKIPTKRKDFIKLSKNTIYSLVRKGEIKSIQKISITIFKLT